MSVLVDEVNSVRLGVGADSSGRDNKRKDILEREHGRPRMLEDKSASSTRGMLDLT